MRIGQTSLRDKNGQMKARPPARPPTTHPDRPGKSRQVHSQTLKTANYGKRRANTWYHVHQNKLTEQLDTIPLMMGAKRTSSCAPHLRPGLIVKSKSKLVSASKDQTPDRPRVKNWKEKEISEEKSSGGFWHVPKGSGLPSFCDIHLSLRSLSASASIALIGARQVRGRSPLGPVTASSERREKIPTGRPFQSPAALADLTCMHPRDQGSQLSPVSRGSRLLFAWEAAEILDSPLNSAPSPSSEGVVAFLGGRERDAATIGQGSQCSLCEPLHTVKPHSSSIRLFGVALEESGKIWRGGLNVFHGSSGSGRVLFTGSNFEKSLGIGKSCTCLSMSWSDPGPTAPAVKTKPKKKSWNSTGKSRRGYGWNTEQGKSSVYQIMSPAAAELVRSLQKQKDVDGLWDALDSLPSGRESWSDLTDCVMEIRNQQNWLLVIQILEWMLQSKQFRADVVCYNLLIEAYGKIGQYTEAEKTFFLLRKSFVAPTEMSYNMLMGAYSKAGLLDKAERLFDQMKEDKYIPDLSTYNIFLEVLAKAGKYKKAERVFSEMKANCNPSAATYTSMINIYGRARLPEMAEKLYSSMRDSDCPPTLYTMTALINAYAKEGLCEKAEEAFHNIKALGLEPDVYSYNALMGAYSHGGFPAGASEVFDAMKDDGIDPDQVSYNILIDAFSRAGQSEEAERVFKIMKDHGFQPTSRSYMLLLKGLLRAGQVMKAENLIKGMEADGRKPDTFMYNSLLHAKGTRGNFVEVERLFNVMKSGSRSRPDISTYNILININAQAGFIDKAENIFNNLEREGLVPNVTTWTSLMGAYSKRKLFKKCLNVWDRMIKARCVPDAATWKVFLASCNTQEEMDEVTALTQQYQSEGLRKARNKDHNYQ
ncbi:hypothetical protein AXG93_4129s1160 [Marchantia polymorpha subsp. ruderalis]|uniref:Uncharacterized protein n=1 Tax=Marchantia polymorpha subsp. ruderalis TaxID=1480154 RepID=A0A176VGP6_MARPO|nr:hypothetical protein AXG93_4129s1160 [Marchantia polymorpha subsp. ruderalis]